MRKLRKPESERKRYIVLAVDLFYRKVINEREGKPRLGACIIFAMVMVRNIKYIISLIEWNQNYSLS